MHVLMTGGTGFIGQQLCRALLADGHQISVYSRRPEQVSKLCGQQVFAVTALRPDQLHGPVDAVINLAGEPIADRPWTQARKDFLRKSRIDVTLKLVELCADLEPRPQVLLSCSAVGYYGDQGDATVTETTEPVADFAHELCRDWEKAALSAEALGLRVCLVRTGLVLGHGGFLKRLLIPFKLGLGGRLGSGRQWMPWIHLHDLTNIYLYLLHHSDCRGIYNAMTPHPVTNREFTQSLAKQLKRPSFATLPAFALRLLFGEMSVLLLGGQKAIPARLQKETSFQFEFETIEEALADILTPRNSL